MKKLLFIGDAACGSGFGRASHYILEELRQRWEVSVIGINYRGYPHKYPYDIYPAWATGDGMGLRALKDLIPKIQPDLIVLQTNPWNVPAYQMDLAKINASDIPLVGIVAVEGKNCCGWELNGLRRAIFWTEFARKEATEGGMKVPSSVVGLGVDTTIYKPGDRVEARKFLGLGPVADDAFIVTNVNRNQNRKRIDLSILYFSEWIRTRGIKDAYLYLHLLPGSSTHVNADQLAQYCGTASRLILAEPKDIFNGAPEPYVVAAYQASNIGLNTTLGEGWGLTSMEAAACGRQQIVGDYAAIGEWGKDVLRLVPIISEGIMPDVRTMIGGVPSKEAMLEALDFFYQNRDECDIQGEAARQLVNRAEFHWSHVGRAFAAEIERES